MAIKNLKIYRDSQEELKRLREEYTMIGYDTHLGNGVLTVFTLRRRKQKPKQTDDGKNEKVTRNKRAESHANDRQKKS